MCFKHFFFFHFQSLHSTPLGHLTHISTVTCPGGTFFIDNSILWLFRPQNLRVLSSSFSHNLYKTHQQTLESSSFSLLSSPPPVFTISTFVSLKKILRNQTDAFECEVILLLFSKPSSGSVPLRVKAKILALVHKLPASSPPPLCLIHYFLPCSLCSATPCAAFQTH